MRAVQGFELVHSEDLESHARSVEEDMEYWRTKRIEPRVFRLIRKGEITFSSLILSAEKLSTQIGETKGSGPLEERIEALEHGLGKFIRAVEVSTSIIGKLVLVEEGRKEAGVYDETMRFVHRHLEGHLEQRVALLEEMLLENMILVRALLAVLTEKGLITSERLTEMLEAPKPPRFENGAMIVAKAWSDPVFKSRILSDAKGTLRELGFALNRTPKLVVVEDTENVHNVIVCTLCSCYPYELLGNPPWWYKHESYRNAIVDNPRETLEAQFKLAVPQSVEVRVHDSTSDIRYMVLPKRPRGTDGMSEEELSRLVTQDSLIGVGETNKPVVSRIEG